MKRIQKYIIAILAFGMVIAGCNEQEDFESSPATSIPVAEIAISAVGDSTATLTLTSNSAGYIGYILAEDTSLAPEALNLLSNNMADEAGVVQSNYFRLTTPGDTTIVFTGLTQASYYKIYAAASSEVGVESDVITFTVKTDDGWAPNLIDASPLPSDEATVEVGQALSYTFDEPILIDTTKAFTIDYLIEGVTQVVSAASLTVSGSTLTIEQDYSSYSGDYFTVSWEAGAVTDLSGNAMEAIASSYDFASEEGSSLYYRTATGTFNVTDQDIMPSTDSIVAQHDFMVDIKFPYAISLLADITADMITFKYTDWEGLSVSTISGAEGISVVGDSTLRIVQPQMANHGDLIELSVAEGVVEDMYNNINAASEYELGWNLGDFHMYDASYMPTTDSILRVQDFTVKAKFDFPITLINDSTGSQVYYTILDSEGEKMGDVLIVASVDPTNDSTLLLPAVAIPNFTSVVLHVEEGVIADAAGNVNLELKEDISWAVEPELETDISLIYGSYEAINTSGYYGTSDTFNIVISEYTSSPTDTVVVTGLFGSSNEILVAFNAGMLNMPAWQSFGDIMGDGSDIVSLYIDNDEDYSGEGVFIKGELISISWGGYIIGGTYDGYVYDKYPNAKWSKTTVTSKSASLQHLSKTISAEKFLRIK